MAGLTPTNWGFVGRWLVGLSRGQAVLDGANTAEPSSAEKGLGWAFHYFVGLGYAALLVMLYGSAIVTAPQAGAFIVVGMVISTLAGMTILMPGMGAGFLGAKLPNQGQKIAMMIVGHGVFAAAQFACARALAELLGP